MMLSAADSPATGRDSEERLLNGNFYFKLFINVADEISQKSLHSWQLNA